MSSYRKLDIMPDGTDFLSWEKPAAFARTLHVDTSHQDHPEDR